MSTGRPPRAITPTFLEGTHDFDADAIEFDRAEVRTHGARLREGYRFDDFLGEQFLERIGARRCRLYVDIGRCQRDALERKTGTPSECPRNRTLVERRRDGFEDSEEPGIDRWHSSVGVVQYPRRARFATANARLAP
jgi:hypothetical protein